MESYLKPLISARFGPKAPASSVFIRRLVCICISLCISATTAVAAAAAQRSVEPAEGASKGQITAH